MEGGGNDAKFWGDIDGWHPYVDYLDDEDVNRNSLSLSPRSKGKDED